jgi:Domain of unknown function (DUF4266)
MSYSRVFTLLIIAIAVATSGCSSLGVRPWQRDILSRSDMQPGGSALDDAINDHMYFSKEASSGGRSFAGGGCGCN